MTYKNWLEYYTPENKAVLDAISATRFGKIEIDVHGGKAITLYFGKKIRLNNARDRKVLRDILQE